MGNTADYPLKWITRDLAVGYAPRSVTHLQNIQAAGVASIVNLCAECYDLHEAERDFGFEVFFLPVVDEGAPLPAQLEEVMNWMDGQVESGRKILVHCRYGIGRTGTVVLAYLIHSGVSFSKAQDMMEHTPSWPSTQVQKKLVDSYIEKTQGIDPGLVSLRETSAGSLGSFFRRLKAVMKWDD